MTKIKWLMIFSQRFHGARTHNSVIKSHKLYRQRQPGAPERLMIFNHFLALTWTSLVLCIRILIKPLMLILSDIFQPFWAYGLFQRGK